MNVVVNVTAPSGCVAEIDPPLPRPIDPKACDKPSAPPSGHSTGHESHGHGSVQQKLLAAMHLAQAEEDADEAVPHIEHEAS